MEMKSPGKRNGEEALRTTLAAVVGKGCTACPAVKWRKECRVRGWRRTGCFKESREKAGKSYFF